MANTTTTKDRNGAMPTTVTCDGMTLRIEAIAWHRNGIGGAPFHVVCFRWADDGEEPRPMVATVFDAPGYVAVLDRELTRHADIAFAMGNSWRGDHFEPALRHAIAAYDEAEAARWGLSPASTQEQEG